MGKDIGIIYKHSQSQFSSTSINEPILPSSSYKKLSCTALTIPVCVSKTPSIII